MSIVKYLESLEYGEGDGGLDVVEYKGRVCMMAVSYTHLTLPTNREV